MPHWRPKFSTAGSCVTPGSAWIITAGEIPAAGASRHRRHAAAAGGERDGGEEETGEEEHADMFPSEENFR